MSEVQPEPEEQLVPDTLAVPDQFWEDPLPPAVTHVAVQGEADQGAAEGEPAVDLSLPPFWTDDAGPEPAPAADERPIDLTLTPSPAGESDWERWAADTFVGPAPLPETPEEPPIDVSLASVAPATSGPDPVADPSLWVWDGLLMAAPEAADPGPAIHPVSASSWPEEVVDPEPVAAQPATARVIDLAAWRAGWADWWRGDGVRAAMVALVVGVAALVAFLGRPDRPGSDDFVQSTDPSRTTVAPTVAPTVPPPRPARFPPRPARRPPRRHPRPGTPPQRVRRRLPAVGPGPPRPRAAPHNGAVAGRRLPRRPHPPRGRHPCRQAGPVARRSSTTTTTTTRSPCRRRSPAAGS